MKGKLGPLGALRENEIRRGAVDRIVRVLRVQPQVRPLLFHDVALANGVEEREGGAVDTRVGVGVVDRLEQVPNVPDVNPGFPDGVGLFHHFDDGAIFEAFNGLELGKVVQRLTVELASIL